jgi:hypothetical protein
MNFNWVDNILVYSKSFVNKNYYNIDNNDYANVGYIFYDKHIQ